MNEIAKKSINEKLMKALHDESITTNGCGRLLGINPTYISMMKNPKLWNSCSVSAWETVLKWVNSGQKLQEYGKKHGVMTKERLMMAKEKEIIPEKKSSKESNAVLIGTVNAHEEQKKEHKKLSIGEMVDLLLAEKALLKQKVDAIDTLLKFYIS